MTLANYLSRGAVLGGALVALGGPAEAIIGGQAVSSREALARQTVLIINADSHGCTGTLVGRTSVLTAAHCVRNTRAAAVAFIRDGRVVAIAPARTAALHPGLGGGGPIDVAVLGLAAAAPAGFAPASLAARDPAVGRSVTIAGFGRPFLDSNRGAGQLRRVSLPVLRRTVSGYTALGSLELLNGSLAASACQGDSGGPVMSGGQVVGVLSLVSGPRETRGCGALTIAMPVVSIAPWIRRQIADAERAGAGAAPASLTPPPGARVSAPSGRQGLPTWASRDQAPN